MYIDLQNFTTSFHTGPTIRHVSRCSSQRTRLHCVGIRVRPFSLLNFWPMNSSRAWDWPKQASNPGLHQLLPPLGTTRLNTHTMLRILKATRKVMPHPHLHPQIFVPDLLHHARRKKHVHLAHPFHKPLPQQHKAGEPTLFVLVNE